MGGTSQSKVVAELNELAREIDTNNVVDLEDSEQAHRASELVDRLSFDDSFVNSLIKVQNEGLSSNSGGVSLSNREIEVVTLKRKGLIHGAIALTLSCKDGHVILAQLENEASVLTKSTVDEYSRRAKKKYEQAGLLISALDGMYGDKDRSLDDLFENKSEVENS